jgi:hypothetical protein
MRGEFKTSGWRQREERQFTERLLHPHGRLLINLIISCSCVRYGFENQVIVQKLLYKGRRCAILIRLRLSEGGLVFRPVPTALSSKGLGASAFAPTLRRTSVFFDIARAGHARRGDVRQIAHCVSDGLCPGGPRLAGSRYQAVRKCPVYRLISLRSDFFLRKLSSTMRASHPSARKGRLSRLEPHKYA